MNAVQKKLKQVRKQLVEIAIELDTNPDAKEKVLQAIGWLDSI